MAVFYITRDTCDITSDIFDITREKTVLFTLSLMIT